MARTQLAPRRDLGRGDHELRGLRPGGDRLWVCLFDEDGSETRHELTERSLGIWHGALPGVAVGQRYGFRADGPWEPGLGLRFNPHKLLLDPYARAVSGEVTPGPGRLR